MPKINVKTAVWKDGDYYVAQCLNVDVSSFGESRKKALEALDEALELYFEDTNIVSAGRKEIPYGTFKSILRQSNLVENNFLK
jgi:predicted RNase H-like HicB family nuclease